MTAPSASAPEPTPTTVDDEPLFGFEEPDPPRGPVFAPGGPSRGAQPLWAEALDALRLARSAVRAGTRAAVETLKDTGGKVGEQARDVKDAAVDLQESARAGAAAMAHTAERAAHAPADIAGEVRKQLDAWGHGFVRTLALGGAVGVLALFALVTLTMGAVVGLNALLGDPVGTILVGLFYAVTAALGLAAIKRNREATKEEIHLHGEHAKEEAQRVARPLQRALERGDI